MTSFWFFLFWVDLIPLIEADLFSNGQLANLPLKVESFWMGLIWLLSAFWKLTWIGTAWIEKNFIWKYKGQFEALKVDQYRISGDIFRVWFLKEFVTWKISFHCFEHILYQYDFILLGVIDESSLFWTAQIATCSTKYEFN